MLSAVGEGGKVPRKEDGFLVGILLPNNIHDLIGMGTDLGQCAVTVNLFVCEYAMAAWWAGGSCHAPISHALLCLYHESEKV